MYFTFKNRSRSRLRWRNKMAVLVSLVLSSGTLGLSPLMAEATPKIEYGMYTVAGKQIQLPHADIRIDSAKLTAGKGEVPPIILNSRTVVSVRMISEKLGASVEWNEKAEEVTLQKGDKNIVLKIGSPTATVNGIEKVLPDRVSPTIVNGRTMLPVKFLADEFSMKIHYDAPTNSIDLMTSGAPIFEKELTEEEKQMILGKVETSPSGTEPANPAPVFDPLQPPSVVAPVVPSQPTDPVHPTLPVVPNSPSPVVPQPNDAILINPEKIMPEKQPNLPANASSLRQLAYELEQRSPDHERFVIKSGSGLKFQSFYLKDPERLVVDIHGGFLDPLLEQNKIYATSSFITQMNSFFHSDENRIRMTFPLRPDIARKEITVGKNDRDIVIEYKSQKPKNSNMQYKADRIHAEFELKFISSYPVSDIISDPMNRTVEFRVPYAQGNLKEETREIGDNIVQKIEVTQEAEESKVVLYLKDRISYAVEDNGASSKLRLKFKKQRREIPMIVIDPGHGAHDPGAVAKSTGMTEKALNLMVSKKVQERLLAEGYEVLMTRESDTYPQLKERAVLANSNEADLFISIHCNAGGNPATNGIETLYYPSADNKQSADIFRAELVRISGATDRGLRKRPDLVVLNSTKVPAVLLELGYMTNAAELQRLSDDAYQERLAEGIVNGIKQYLQSLDNISIIG